MGKITFAGRSGQGYGFEGAKANAPWARKAGIAIFAAPGGYGRRVFGVVELSGRAHDIQPIWALAEAERFGATEVFIREEASGEVRQAVLADLEAGLSPVCTWRATKSASPARAGETLADEVFAAAA